MWKDGCDFRTRASPVDVLVEGDEGARRRQKGERSLQTDFTRTHTAVLAAINSGEEGRGEGGGVRLPRARHVTGSSTHEVSGDELCSDLRCPPQQWTMLGRKRRPSLYEDHRSNACDVRRKGERWARRAADLLPLTGVQSRNCASHFSC